MARWRAASSVPWLAWVAGRELVRLRNVAEGELSAADLEVVDRCLGVLLRLAIGDRPERP
jgi:hypothetical protein